MDHEEYQPSEDWHERHTAWRKKAVFVYVSNSDLYSGNKSVRWSCGVYCVLFTLGSVDRKQREAFYGRNLYKGICPHSAHRQRSQSPLYSSFCWVRFYILLPFPFIAVLLLSARSDCSSIPPEREQLLGSPRATTQGCLTIYYGFLFTLMHSLFQIYACDSFIPFLTFICSLSVC